MSTTSKPLERKPRTKPVGRPHTFQPRYLKIVYRLALLGATVPEICEVLDIGMQTYYDWKRLIPEFAEAIKAGGIDADARVTEALFKRAIGYRHQEETQKLLNGRLIKLKSTKQYPPDTTAAFIWLKNRRSIDGTLGEARRAVQEMGDEPVQHIERKQPLRWKDKTEQDVTSGGMPIGLDQDERAKLTRERMLKELGEDNDQG